MSLRKHLGGSAMALMVALGGASAAQADPSLVRIATVPAGAEVAGIAINGLGELFFNAQHPGKKAVVKDGGPAALIGYIAGLNINNYSGGNVAIPGKDDRGKVHVAQGEYVVLGKSGDKLGDGKQLGAVYDSTGKLMWVSNDVDFNAFIPLSSTEAYLYTAFEGAGRLGVGSMSQMKLKRSNGKWSADLSQSKMVDLRSIDGGWVLCFGTVSPWGTPIMSEEYYFYNTSLWNHPNDHDDDERPGFKGGNDVNYHQPKKMDQYLGRPSNPYRYGYNIEINDAASSNPSLVRHYAHGRFSHENVMVMGDGKTLYQSDDDSAKYTNEKYNSNSGGVFFKFVADTAADLSSGTLYAAKLKQDAGSDPRTTGFDVSWIELAHGNNAQIGKWIDEYEGISHKDYKEGGTNFVSDADVNNWAEGKTGKDLNGDGKVGSYKDDRPAFLESRKAAAALGAANDWNKMEGIAADNNNVYVAASNITESMDKAWGDIHWSTGKKDKAAPGQIALDKEACGAVYKGALTADYDITRLEPYVVGRDLGNKKGCDLDGIASPDNILATATGGLLIAEDAGKRQHPVDFLWLKK
jgi:uncharacterized protein